ncbi:sister chromatid cohesion protein Dcc1 [Lobosporangium transversale]|uniref:Sister chromatid cohesion protein Dcc1 n=1 Tax=Lobosporangium transversale TaxID=64571 RepID=A0A1Y2GWQ5_9FUNG|nr:sister chromatid cohesion protein Dcc1 [Lobosporangium transversale]ORZ21787.1 sister chromatid cohesion protein Dcc1 [Lobosporangium transversale]|eukprot:XP_021883038.1 sister chromatid cohesion protein Dcc1 [Lobosporangium transversale]
MANPSTQPPSNATTTNIIFGRDFVQSSYALLEVPKSLENYIDEHESRLVSFQVRGIEKDTAVLCTPTQTFSLQRAHTSNTLIPIAPVIGRKPESHNDMDLDDPYRTDRPDIEESSYGKHAVLDMMNSVLDLIPIPPRLDRLAELLGECLFEGWAHEHEGRLYTWRELQSTVQASDKEILQWLKDKHAKEINGT